MRSKYFNMGHIYISRGVDESIKENEKFAIEVLLAVRRYAVKDWGNLSDEDIQSNEEALNNPDDLYLLAAYDTCEGKIWIITNRISEQPGDNATTILFPDER